MLSAYEPMSPVTAVTKSTVSPGRTVSAQVEDPLQ